MNRGGRDTPLYRFVALKILRWELSAVPVQIRRLDQEARATGAVDDPHVVRVFSSGTDHGQFYRVICRVAEELQTFTTPGQITAALTSLKRSRANCNAPVLE